MAVPPDLTIDPSASSVNPRAQSRFETFSETANLYNRLGNSALAGRAQNRADRILGRNAGLDTSGINTFDNPMMTSPGDTQQAIHGAALLKDKQFRRGDYDRAKNRFNVRQNNNVAGMVQKDFINEIDPSLQQAQGQADQFASQDAIGAGDEQAMRANLAAQVRMQESQRLNRVAAGMGMGDMSNSPVAAALTSQVVEQTDRAITDTMRELGLEVSQVNMQQKRKDVAQAAQIALMRAGLHTSDPTTLAKMHTDVAAMLDAMYSRDQTMDLMEKQMKDAGRQTLSDRLGIGLGLVGGAMSLASGGYQSGMFGGKSSPQGGGPFGSGGFTPGAANTGLGSTPFASGAMIV